MTIIIKRSDLNKIIEHSRLVFPIEACGVLLGTKENGPKTVVMVFPARNILESETSYQINPQDQLDIFMKADELSLEVLGYYHSHPNWRAQPSETDKHRANQPSSSYLIYSNVDDEVRSFQWDGVEFRTEELKVEQNDAA
jgi:proteasome lid subunit RPN8/RPN11